MKQFQFYNNFQSQRMQEELSVEEINFKAKQIPNKQNKDLVSLGESAINELQLKVDLSNHEDVEELSVILVELLSYPNGDMAEIHSNAMRLGNFDLQKPVTYRNDTTSSLMDQKSTNVICPCCGFVKQTSTIDLSTSFDEIKNMGVSTYLYFSIYKKLAILLAILTILYSAFALITNYIASRNGLLANSKSSVDYISISLSSKETNDNADNRRYYFVQCWLGVVTIIVWIFALARMKYTQVKGIEEYDNDTISCSDYSVVMEGMPLDVTKDELQRQLDAFYEGLNPDSIPLRWRKPFKIAKLNVGKPFYLNQEQFKDDELVNIEKEIEQTKQKLVNLIIQRQGSSSFSPNKSLRITLYETYKALNKKKAEKLVQMAANIKKSLKQQSGDEITTVFVTLESNVARSYFEQLHEPSLFGKIKSICGKTQDTFWYQKDGKNYPLDIRRAPEPQDIIWTNLGLRNSSAYCKKFFTFSVTILLLGICFGIVFGLSRAQQSAGGSRPISIAISIIISIVNVMLGQIIRRLTVFEKDYTETYRQASLAIKSVLAQMINTILIPIITAYYVKDRNFYYENGLVDNIFMLSISTIIIPPLLLLVNPYRIVMGIYRCYMSTTKSKLTQTQKQHNILQEGVEFQVGYQSIYPVSTFMFVCFYVSLQPIISVVAMLGYFIMYWVEKYSLFNRYRRPVPGMDFVNNAVYKMVSLGPIVYTFGSLTWSNFSPNGIPREAIIPNLVALALSIILFAIPFNSIIIGACMGDNALKPTNFSDDRIFMPSQYDRLNPNTQTQGFEQYKKFMQKKREQIKHLGKEQQEQFSKKMMINAQRGQLMNQATLQNAQGSNIFQSSFNFYQPQPMMNYGYSPYAAPVAAMPYMGFSPYNPMASFAFGGSGFAQPAPVMMPAPPAIINVPQPVARPPPQPQVQMNQGFNNFPPQNNPMNGYVNFQGSQVSQAASNVSPNPFGQNANFNPNQSQSNNPFNNPVFNPFNGVNNGNNANLGVNFQQGGRW